jgi:hypothetical protein
LFVLYDVTVVTVLQTIFATRDLRQAQESDTSSRPITGTGTRHVPSLPPDRVATPHVVAECLGTMPSLRLSVAEFLPSPIQPVVPIPPERFVPQQIASGNWPGLARDTTICRQVSPPTIALLSPYHTALILCDQDVMRNTDPCPRW